MMCNPFLWRVGLLYAVNKRQRADGSFPAIILAGAVLKVGEHVFHLDCQLMIILEMSLIPVLQFKHEGRGVNVCISIVYLMQTDQLLTV